VYDKVISTVGWSAGGAKDRQIAEMMEPKARERLEGKTSSARLANFVSIAAS